MFVCEYAYHWHLAYLALLRSFMKTLNTSCLQYVTEIGYSLEIGISRTFLREKKLCLQHCSEIRLRNGTFFNNVKKTARLLQWGIP